MRRFHRAVCGALLVSCCATASRATADGWHNAALATSSLDQWLADVKAAVPNLDKKMSSSELKAGHDLSEFKKGREKNGSSGSDKKPGKGAPRQGGSIAAELTPEQQQLVGRKANDCLEALAFMDPKNIFPREFPNFQLEKIPKYHKAAKQLLSLMGPVGATAVVGELRSELMGMGRSRAQGVEPRRDYHDELLALLRQAGMRGDVSEADLESLREAASGAKAHPLTGLAQKVQLIITDIEASVELAVLVERIEGIGDAKRKQQLTARARKKLPQAATRELLDAVKVSQAGSPMQKDILKELQQRLDRMSVLDLLRLGESVRESDLARAAAVELGQKRPKFADVKGDLAEIASYLESGDKALAEAARDQMVNAFQRAPVRDCLDWLARGDKRLTPLIWEQLDDRIARAEADRKAGYREVALEVAGDRSSRSVARIAALDLLGRLRDKEAAGPLIELLPQLPRELWGKAGLALEKLTGQRFGPKAGDGVAELNVAVKKWRAWKAQQ
ncbi:MAG TPA: hypothetical protein VG826_23360 [Pirellulales bacterium]|nr:hypothetical protein [Pirellulales bacterium]